MKTPSRKALRETLQGKGLEASLRIGKTGLTNKQKRFAEALVLEGMNASDAYRSAYNTKGNPATVNPAASRLLDNAKVAATVAALERAKELSAWQSAESLRSLVISTLTEIATDEHTKAATRVSAVKVLGTVVGVDAFRETKRIEHVKDSGEIRSQILDQLKTMMLGTNDAVDVDADSLLAELSGDDSIESANENSQDDSPTLPGECQFDNGTPPSTLHSNPHEASQHFFEGSPIPLSTPPSTPLSEESQPPGGDIFGEKDEVAK